MAQDAVDRLQGALTNLLSHCAGLEPGARLLVVGEEKGSGYYDDDLAETVTRMAVGQGFRTRLVTQPFCADVDAIDERLADEMATADCTIFFARLGDQLRFRDMPDGFRSVVCYTLDLGALGSAFGTAHYQAFMAFKRAIDRMIGAASHIRVTCPRGTDFSGQPRASWGQGRCRDHPLSDVGLCPGSGARILGPRCSGRVSAGVRLTLLRSLWTGPAMAHRGAF